MFNFFWYLDFFLMPCSLRLTHGLAQRLAHNRGRAVQIRTTETMAHAQFDFARFGALFVNPVTLSCKAFRWTWALKIRHLDRKLRKTDVVWTGPQQCLIAFFCVHSRTWRCTYWLKCTCAQASTLCARPCRVREWRRCPCLSKLRSGITSGTLPKWLIHVL